MGRMRYMLVSFVVVTLALAPAVGKHAAAAANPPSAPWFDATGAHLDGVTLRLAALGRGDTRTALALVTPTDDGTRVTFAHGEATEWFVRQAGGGVEQGVTLAVPPPGDGPLTLMVATPDAIPLVDADGVGASLLVPDGGTVQRYRYAGLRVTDATGATLPGHLEATDGGVAIAVDDTDATYPLTVDPYLLRQTLTEPGAANNDQFGYAVAVSGDGNTLVAGATGTSTGQGRAYVYTKSGSSYGAPLTLTDPGAANGDVFGVAVAVSGDGSTVVVGANGTSSFQGQAYVYTRSGGSYGSPTTLTEPGAASSDRFGTAVAVSEDGSTLVVSALGTSNFQGRTYVYTKSGSSYGTPTTLTEPGAANYDQFGYAVAVSGDGGTVVVGAIGTSTSQGRAYVYAKSGGSYGTPLTLAEPSPANHDFFGNAVAVSGDGSTLVVGAPGTSTNQGRAYAYTKSGSSYGTPTTLADPGAANSDDFGFAVAVSGDGSTLVVGAFGTSGSQGRAYIYTLSGGSYGMPTTLTDPGATGYDRFGFAVAVNGDGGAVVVGAWGTSGSQGRAYVIGAVGALAPLGSASPQNAPVTTPFASPLAVRVTDGADGQLAGVPVTFTAPATGPSGLFSCPMSGCPSGTSVTNGGLAATVTSDTYGVATAPTFTANITAGSYAVTASVAKGNGDVGTTTLSLTNTAGAVASISTVSGDHGSAQIGNAFAAPLVVLVKDAHNNPVPNATVTFSAPSGNVPGATFANSGTATTDASGEASITATAAGRPGPATITATVNGASTTFTLNDVANPAATVTITGFSPPTVAVGSSTTVTITGTNFGSTATVMFGNQPGTNVTVSGNTITVTAPMATSAGTVDISVTTNGQTATVHGFTYLPGGGVSAQPGIHPQAGGGNVIGHAVPQPERHDDAGSGGGGSGGNGGAGPNAAPPMATPLPQPGRH